MKNFWDERYASDEYVYGTEPNSFFKEQLTKLQPGKILLPAEGEGRNAVFAAKLGWLVAAFDQSNEGKKKATKLAKKNKVQLDYQTVELSKINYKPNSFNCLGLLYAHFPADFRFDYHQKLDQLIQKGGTIILEGFSKNHLELSAKNKESSGPKNINMLFSIEDIKKDFPNYEIIVLEEKIVDLNEGLFHNDKSAVIRFVGKKK